MAASGPIWISSSQEILNQSYSRVYQWGGDTDFARPVLAPVLAMHKQSEFSYKMLDVVKTMPALGDTTVCGKDTFPSFGESGQISPFSHQHSSIRSG